MQAVRVVLVHRIFRRQARLCFLYVVLHILVVEEVAIRGKEWEDPV